MTVTKLRNRMSNVDYVESTKRESCVSTICIQYVRSFKGMFEFYSKWLIGAKYASVGLYNYFDFDRRSISLFIFIIPFTVTERCLYTFSYVTLRNI